MIPAGTFYENSDIILTFTAMSRDKMLSVKSEMTVRFEDQEDTVRLFITNADNKEQYTIDAYSTTTLRCNLSRKLDLDEDDDGEDDYDRIFNWNVQEFEPSLSFDDEYLNTELDTQDQSLFKIEEDLLTIYPGTLFVNKQYAIGCQFESDQVGAVINKYNVRSESLEFDFEVYPNKGGVEYETPFVFKVKGHSMDQPLKCSYGMLREKNGERVYLKFGTTS